MTPYRCTLHGYELVHSHNRIVDGVKTGIFKCPSGGCISPPRFGKPVEDAGQGGETAEPVTLNISDSEVQS